MDTVLCDELLQEILQRLPPSSAPSVSLVSRRWLSLFRSSTSSLSLRIPHLCSSSSSPSPAPVAAAAGAISAILSHYTFLDNLTIVDAQEDDGVAPADADAILLVVAASACSGRLSHLRFLPDSPLTPSALRSSAAAFSRLTSLQIASLLPLSLRWLAFLPSLKSFSLFHSSPRSSPSVAFNQDEADDDDNNQEEDEVLALPIESLSLSGIRAADGGLSWLWRRCSNLRWLQLRACEGTGDGHGNSSSTSFPLCLGGLLGLELRTCRSIADRVLLHAADRCHSLTSLLLYDGGSRDALHHFIHLRGAALRTLDLRLPLDLHNDHLLAIAADDWRRASRPVHLTALRLQSCCLVTGDGLRSLARSPVGAAIEELALVNCDVVEREHGLLTFLGQSMQRLRRLDLSHNEALADKEVGAMLASCKNLVEIRLRGCGALTGATVISLLKCCSRLMEIVDITRCPGIGADAVEILALNVPRLNQIFVEECKLSKDAKRWLSVKGIIIG